VGSVLTVAFFNGISATASFLAAILFRGSGERLTIVCLRSWRSGSR
jgi:hypothetical protein